MLTRDPIRTKGEGADYGKAGTSLWKRMRR